MPGELVICGLPFGETAERDALRQVRELGFTAVQTYTFWQDFEPVARDRQDWEVLDRQVGLIREAGLKWVPFLIIGPKYGSPAWWLADPGHRGLRCLEHGHESPIESPWNPAFRREISRVLDVFAAHYLPWQVIESVQPGIGGDYGEAIYPVLGNWPGDYHTHRGFWCGGDEAAADFRRHLAAVYPTVAALNHAWRSRHPDFAAIRPFLPHHAPSRTAACDLVAWYRAAMTAYADFWMEECKRAFPGIPAYLCTGGADDETTSGALFAAQAKAAARHGGGIRLTNEGNTFAYNFPLTAHTWAACRHYGAHLGLEPVGPLTEQGVRARIFGSAAFGNRQIFHYYGNLFGKDHRALPAAAAVREHAGLIGAGAVERGIGFFWPIDQATLQGGGLKGSEASEGLLHVRRNHPVSPLSEELILDGALTGLPCLVMLGAVSTRAAVLRRIAAWVRDEGGILLAVGLCRDLELEPVPEFDALFGIGPEAEEAWGHCSQVVQAPAEWPGLARIPRFHVERGWLGLAADVEQIARAQPGPGGGLQRGTRVHPVSALFRRRHPGGGQAIQYCGYVVFQQDPQALFADPGVFPALLDDVCAGSGVRAWDPRPGELACGRAGGRRLGLRADGITSEPDPG